MKTYGEVHVQISVVFTSVLFGCEWSVSCPGRLIPGERARVSIVQAIGWATKADLHAMEKCVGQHALLIRPGNFLALCFQFTVHRLPFDATQSKTTCSESLQTVASTQIRDMYKESNLCFLRGKQAAVRMYPCLSLYRPQPNQVDN
jgi:hypothetical protein